MASNKTFYQRKISFNKNVKSEIKLLRSFVMSMIQEDKEGKYDPKFVKEILRAIKEKPTHFFFDSKSFLKELR